MRIAPQLASAAIVLVLTGCSSLNPFASKSAPKNPPAELVDFKPTMAMRTSWSVPVGNAGSYVFSPASSGNSIYAASADGSIVRIETESGRQVWRINAGTGLTAGVGTDGSIVAVAGEKGAIFAFDSDGRQRWKAQASSEVLSSPVVAQGLVIVRSVDNRIVAYDADSGERRWVVQRTVPSLTLRSAPGILVAGQSAYVALPGGRLLVLALNNGGARWEVAVGDPRGATELERIADTSGTPVLAGRDVCAVAYQGRVACFDALSGTAHWAKDLSSDVGLGVDERFIFAADEQGAVSAFARDSGSSVWRNTKLAHRRLSTPVSYGRAVAVGDFQGYVHFLSREEGALLARVSTDGSPVIGIPQVAGSHVVFQTQAGTLAALKAD